MEGNNYHLTGRDDKGLSLLPDILVTLRRSGGDSVIGAVQEVLPDGSCRIALGLSGSGETVTALPSEIDVVVPKKRDMIKVIGGAYRGTTGKLIGIDDSDDTGIIKVDETLDVKLIGMNILAKLAQS